MKLTIARTHLAAALAAVRNTARADADASQSILANVRLAAESKTLTLTTTDLTATLQTHVEATVETKGQITVPAALLHDLVKSFKADTVTLYVVNSDAGAPVLKVQCGTASFDLATLPADEFPPLEKPADARAFELLEHELSSLLGRTTFARGVDDKRPVLQGTLLRLDGDTFVAACDGHRLAVEQGAPVTVKADLNLPAKAVGELRRLLSADPDKPRTVAIDFTPGWAQFTFGRHQLLTRLIEGDYPDYTRIVPTLEDARIATVDRLALLSALKRVALISDGVQLVFQPKGLAINSRDTAGKQAGRSVETLTTTGTVAATAAHPVKLLIEALEAIEPAASVNLYPGSDSPIAIHDPTSTWLGVVAAMK